MNRTKNLWRLSFALAKTQFKLKNEGSYLGIFWYLLNPLLMFILLLLIFSDRLGSQIHFYPLYLLLGIIMFNFFQQATTESTKAIMGSYSPIIKSINFPKESLIISTILKNIYSHIFEIILFVILSLILGAPLTGLIFYPLILIFFCVFIFGCCLIFSALTVYFVDLDNIWNFLVRVIWFATPIFYDIGGQTKLFYLNLFNPVYYYITITRDLVIYTKIPELWLVIGAATYSLLFLVLGLLIFNRLKNKFAELI